jgi:hypothetical protein
MHSCIGHSVSFTGKVVLSDDENLQFVRVFGWRQLVYAREGAERDDFIPGDGMQRNEISYL